MKIGIFDSGVGGFSILATVLQHFPQHSFVYLSDHSRFPYSEKSVAQLQEISSSNAKILIHQTCNPIIVACNTATVTALAHLRETFTETTFIGTVPAVKPAAETLPSGSHIVVLATKNTAESAYLHALISPWKCQHRWTVVGTTTLVEAIENWDERGIKAELSRLLIPVQQTQPIDGIVLGCTHFPFIEQFISEILQIQPHSPITFFEPSIGISKQLERALASVTAHHQITAEHPSPTVQFQSTKLHTDFVEYSDNPQLQEQFSKLRKLLKPTA